MLYPVEDHALRRQTGQRKLTFVCRTCGNKEVMTQETLAKPVYKNIVTHTEKYVGDLAVRPSCGIVGWCSWLRFLHACFNLCCAVLTCLITGGSSYERFPCTCTTDP